MDTYVRSGLDDESRIAYIFRITRSVSDSFPDTAIYFLTKAVHAAHDHGFVSLERKGLGQMANVYYNQGRYTDCINANEDALKLAETLDDKVALSQLLSNLAGLYSGTGDYDKGKALSKRSIKLAKALKDTEMLATAYNNLAGNCYNSSAYEEAADYFIAALKVYEMLGNEGQVATEYNNMSLVYSAQKLNKTALKYQFKALAIYERLPDHKLDIARCYNNIGNTYKDLKQEERALAYFRQALDIRLNYGGTSHSIAISYGNIANIYKSKGKYDSAIEMYRSALNTFRQAGDVGLVCVSEINMADLYDNQGEFDTALVYAESALTTSTSIHARETRKEALRLISAIYLHTGDKKKAYQYLHDYSALKDSILNEKSAQQINEMESRYQSEKKIREINLMEQENKVNEMKMSHKKMISAAVAFCLVLMLMLTGFSFRASVLKKRQQGLLESTNVRINDQKILIEEKNNDIMDSITYARRLQTAMMPTTEELLSGLRDAFVLLMPKDIVSGDFYWYKPVPPDASITKAAGEDGINYRSVLLAVCDCTGHGVPGAMISVVCHNALQRSMMEFGCMTPATILDKASELVMETFSAAGQQIHDGMDAALCRIDTGKDKVRVQFAGAFNPLYYYANGKLNEIKPDRQSVGSNSGSFTNHEIWLHKGDLLYLFTDGFADQFGGPQYKKFMNKSLKSLIKRVHRLPLNRQKEELITAHEEWKGEKEQIDDICIIGLSL